MVIENKSFECVDGRQSLPILKDPIVPLEPSTTNESVISCTWYLKDFLTIFHIFISLILICLVEEELSVQPES